MSMSMLASRIFFSSVSLLLVLACTQTQRLTETDAVLTGSGDRVALGVVWLGEHAALPTVRAVIRGETYTFVLDTGASCVAVSEELADKLSLSVSGDHSVKTLSGTVRLSAVTVPPITVGKALLPSQEAIVMPQIDRMRADYGVRIHGVLGAPFFRGVRVRIHYAEGWVELLRHVQAAVEEPLSSVPISLRDSCPWVQAEISGTGSHWFQLDTGAAFPMGVTNSSSVYPRIANLSNLQVLDIYRAPARLGRLESIRIGELEFRDVPAEFHDKHGGRSTASAVLGSGLFLLGELDIDYLNRRVSFRSTRPVLRCAPAWGVGVEVRDGILRVVRVDPKGAADLAGVRVWDRIVRLNGVAVGPSPSQFHGRLHEASVATLELVRDGSLLEVSLGKRTTLPLAQFE